VLENKISKRILEESLGEGRSAEKPRNRGEGELLSDAAILFNKGMWRTGRESDRGRKQGKSWPESGLKDCRKKKLDEKKEGGKVGEKVIQRPVM
jgi:hypothetical protein